MLLFLSLRHCSALRCLRAIRRVNQAQRRSSLIKSKSIITVSLGLRPRHLISQTYLSTRGKATKKEQQCNKCDENPEKPGISLASFPPHIFLKFARFRSVCDCRYGLLFLDINHIHYLTWVACQVSITDSSPDRSPEGARRGRLIAFTRFFQHRQGRIESGPFYCSFDHQKQCRSK